jgi:hypothetical protein
MFQHPGVGRPGAKCTYGVKDNGYPSADAIYLSVILRIPSGHTNQEALS